MRLLVGSLVRLLVGKSCHTKQKDGYNSPTNEPTNNHIHWIWMNKKIGLYFQFQNCVYSNPQYWRYDGVPVEEIHNKECVKKAEFAT